MKLFEYINRINLLDKLIREKRTGTPEMLAERLSLSVSRLYVVLDELKHRGAPIKYSRQAQTYFYKEPFEISIKADFTPLSNNVVVDINDLNFD